MPIRLGEIPEIAGRWPTGIRHQDIRLRTCRQSESAPLFRRDVTHDLVTFTPNRLRMSLAASASGASPRATITTFTPSAASASAQPRPNPRLTAQTSAVFPYNAKSIWFSPVQLQNEGAPVGACRNKSRRGGALTNVRISAFGTVPDGSGSSAPHASRNRHATPDRMPAVRKTRRSRISS